ncbi:MAG: DUF4124 domain-containing protein [Candidatus Thiodiazotropha sp.]
MKQLILLLSLMLVASPAISGKLYKWVGEDGTVNYTQSPPPDAVKNENTKEMNISSTTIKPIKKRGKYYCGSDQLPSLDRSAAVNISNLQARIYDWEDALERRQTDRAKYIKRRHYSAKNLNEALQRFNRDDLEDRCKIEWAQNQLSSLQGEKKKIFSRHEMVKSAIQEIEEKKARECGVDERTGFITVDDEYNASVQCKKRFDRELRKLERELKKAERNRNLVETE